MRRGLYTLVWLILAAWFFCPPHQIPTVQAGGVVSGGGSGDIEDVGECTTGACLPLDGSTSDIGIQDRIVAEGVTANAFETTVSFDDPTADRTLTIPDFSSSTVVSVRKTADEIVNNSATLQDDDALLLAMAANETWFFAASIAHVGNAVADFKVAFTIPAGAAIRWGCHSKEGDGGGLEGCASVTTSGGTTVMSDNPTAQHLLLMGVVVNGGTTGNLQMQWAQNTAAVVDTKVLTNSYLEAHK